MDALKVSLREKGYRIQWNIILLLFGAHSFQGVTARRYEELCKSSGGVFQVISDGYSNNGGDASLQQFLDAYDAQSARERFRDHMLSARTDSGEDIEVPLLTPGNRT